MSEVASAEKAGETELFRALFRPMGADGVYARTAAHEAVVEALGALISRHRNPEAEVLRFPPVMSRRVLEASGYLASFPNLAGCVSCLDAPVRGAIDAKAWPGLVIPADLVLTPASCYPVYPIAASKGTIPAHGRHFDVGCDCFRREPTTDLRRLQSFRMREFVLIGEPELVAAFRGDWIRRARGVADSLQLPYEVEVAHDPFFGRGASFLAASQIEQQLKFELLVPIFDYGPPTACMSFNLHQDHFGDTFSLRLESGAQAHSGCVAFGMDRLTLALFAVHGVTIQDWPQPVRERLGL